MIYSSNNNNIKKKSHFKESHGAKLCGVSNQIERTLRKKIKNVFD